MRDVVRDRLVAEFSPRGTCSLNRPIGRHGDNTSTLTLEELLPAAPDSSENTGDRELKRMAGELAPALVAGLTLRQKIAFLIRLLGVPLIHPAAVKAAQCAKTAIDSAYNDALLVIANFTRARFTSEDRSTQSLMAVFLCEEVKTLIIKWGKSEKTFANLFTAARAKEVTFD
ncbi:MAG: hypothetical protein C0404_13575 [Verrucomicrobia bacterium]|nr:hypothetical protein [Verrucomicrobiota bacterium]